MSTLKAPFIDRRFQFLYWLNHKVFKIEEGAMMPKFSLFVYRVLFPLNWLYDKQTHLKFDYRRNLYIIDGRLISKDFLDFMCNPKNGGKTFTIINVEMQDNVVVPTILLDNEINKHIIFKKYDTTK